MHRAKGDRLVRDRVLPVCDNTPIQGKSPLKSSWNRRANVFGTWYATFGMLTIRPEARQRSLPAGKILNNLFGYTNDHTSQSTIFQLYLGSTSTKRELMCLAQCHNAVTPERPMIMLFKQKFHRRRCHTCRGKAFDSQSYHFNALFPHW